MTDPSLSDLEQQRDQAKEVFDLHWRQHDLTESELAELHKRPDHVQSEIHARMYAPFRVQQERLTEQKRILRDQHAGLEHRLGQLRKAYVDADHARLTALCAGLDVTEHTALRDGAEGELRRTERDIAEVHARLGGVSAQLAGLAAIESEHVVSGRPAPGAER